MGAEANDTVVTSGPIGKITLLAISAWRALPIDHTVLVQYLRPAGFQWRPELLALVVLVKLPLILLDLLSAFLIYQIASVAGESRRLGETASLLWLLNPYVIFAIEMWGSNEVLPLCLTLIAAWLTIRNKPVRRSIVLAAAVATKLFPVMLLVVPFKEAIRRSWRWIMFEVILGMVGVAGYFLWSGQAADDPVARLARYDPQTFVFDEFTIATPIISVGLGTMAVVVTWVIVLQFWDWKASSVIPASLAVVASYLAFQNWHPASLLWPIALLAAMGNAGGVGRKGFLLILVGAIFAVLVNHDKILSSASIFFIPVPGAASLVAVKLLQQFSTDEITQVIILPALRALFAALSLLIAADLHIQSGVNLECVAAKF